MVKVFEDGIRKKLVADEEVERVKNLFLNNDMDSMPYNLIQEVYQKLSRIYQTSLAGVIGVYLLGRMHEANKSDG